MANVEIFMSRNVIGNWLTTPGLNASEERAVS